MSKKSYKVDLSNPPLQNFSTKTQASLQQPGHKRIKGRRLKFDSTAELQQKQNASPVDQLNRSDSHIPSQTKHQEQIIKVQQHKIWPQEQGKGNLEAATTDSIVNNHSNKLKETKNLNIEDKTNNQVNAEEIFQCFINDDPRQFLDSLTPKIKNSKYWQEAIDFVAFRQKLFSFIGDESNNKNIQQGQKLHLLRQWISQQIFKQQQQNPNLLCAQKFPQILIPMLKNSLQNYINQLISDDKDVNIQDLLTIANLTDKSFRQAPTQYCFKKFKTELAYINAQTQLNIMIQSSWLLQFGMVCKFYRQLPSPQYGKRIYKRYENKQNNVLPFQLLQLGFSSCINFVQQRHIENLIKANQNHSYYNLFKLLLLMKKHRMKYVSAYRLLIRSILKNIIDPKLYLKILSFSQIETEYIKEYLNTYVRQNKNFLQNTQAQQIFKEDIRYYVRKNQQLTYAPIINEWVLYTELLNFYQRQQYIQYINAFMQDGQRIHNSKIIDFDVILQNMRNIITDFRMACNYKRQKINQYYQLLHKLETKNVFIKKQYNHVILGCKTFIELKRGIFNLKQQQKIDSLLDLVLFLQKKHEQYTHHNKDFILSELNQAEIAQWKHNKIKEQENLKFRKSIQVAVTKILNRKDGQIYLHQITQKLPKEQKLKSIQSFSNQDCKLKLTRQSFSYQKLLKLVNKNPIIYKRIIILLELSQSFELQNN